MAAARRNASVVSHNKDNEQLCTLVNEVTGDVNGDVGMSALPFLHTLVELDEIYVNDFN